MKIAQIRSQITGILKFSIAGGLIYWLIASGRLDLGALAQLLTPEYIVICFALVAIAILINNYRWMILLRGQGFEESYFSTLKLTLIGMFFNIAMPGGVGGDLVKGYYIVRDNTNRKMAAATSVLMDRLLGFFSMTFISVVALLLNFHMLKDNHELVILGMTTGGLFFAFLILFLTAFSARVRGFMGQIFDRLPAGNFLKGLYEALGSYRNAPNTLISAVGLSVISQSFGILFFAVVGSVLEVREVPWQAYTFVVPLGMIAMAAPVAPAGIGVGQAAYLVLFNLYLGYQTQIGPGAVTAYQIVSISWGLLGAYFYFRRKAPVISEVSVGETSF